MSKHTPISFTNTASANKTLVHSRTADGKYEFVADCGSGVPFPECAQANAEFIVKACNHHKEMYSWLSRASAYLHKADDDGELKDCVYSVGAAANCIDALLAKIDKETQ